MPQDEQATTFFFADFAGSARLWERDPASAASVLSQYDAILCRAVEQNGGRVFKTIGDAVCASFPAAAGALTAAIDAQRAMHDASWPLSPPPSVRIAIHSGDAIERGGDFFGPPVNQVARLLQASNDRQTLLSETVYRQLGGDLPADVAWRDLGRHTLRDVQHPIRVYQVDPVELAREFPPLAALEYDPSNLPAQMTSFIGRETELAELRALLAREAIRLVTLTGPGGVGKTRLATQLAMDARARFPDGRYLVELAPVSEPDLVARAIAGALEISDPGNVPLLTAIIDMLRDKRLLLVLDNFEHVSAAAPLVSQLLTACPDLTAIVTSRLRLRLTGEQEYEVPPLTMPVHTGAPVDEIGRNDAVRLFVNRAQATRPQFALTAANASSLVGICRRLDGLPLAIELAAARSKRIPPERILDQLDDRFGFLNQGSRDLPPRQQALRSAIDWSFDLLAPEHRTLFQRLGVFVGGFTLEAAEELLNAPAETGSTASFFDVLDGVSTLVDSSLLQVITAPNGDPRYLMLETIHEYARQRLSDAGELELMSQSHAAWARRLALESRAHWRGPDEPIRLARLDAELANFRAALAWLNTQHPATHHLELAAALWWFWLNRGYLSEGHDQLARALARPGDDAPAARADALTGAATIAYLQGQWSRANELFDQALPLMREAGDERGLVRTLNNAGNVALARDQLDCAAALYDEALTHLRDSGDKTVLGIVLSNLGRIARHRGDYGLARVRFAEAIAVQDEIGERKGRITTTANLADLLFDLDETAEAESLFREVRAGYDALGDRHSVGYALERLARLALIHGDWPTAQGEIDEALTIFDEVGDEDGTASIMMVRADLHRAQGDPAAAATWLLRALDIWRTRETAAALVPALVSLAVVTKELGQPQRTARLLGAIETLRQGAQATISPRDCREIDRATTASRDLLGDAAYAAAFAAGRALPLDAVVTDARQIAPE